MAGDKVKSKKSGKAAEKAPANDVETEQKQKKSTKKKTAADAVDVSASAPEPAKKAKKRAAADDAQGSNENDQAKRSKTQEPESTAGSIASVLTGTASVDPSVNALFTVTSAVPIAAPVLASVLPEALPAEGEDAKASGKKSSKKRKAAPEEGGEEGEDKPEEKKPKREVDPARQDRTVFVGNVPLKMKRDALKRIFKTYGKIESVRFRSVALAKPTVSKKVGFITKDFHPERSSMNAYVVFAEEESAKAALAANGTVVDDHHMVVDIASNNAHDTKHTVFVGGLPFEVETETVWEMFSQCGEVANVRIVRDKKTNFGKGIAYVRFQDAASVGLAERLDGTELGNRKIRVTKALDKKTLEKKAAKKQKPSYQGTQTNASGAARRVAAVKLRNSGKGSKKSGAHKPAKKAKASGAKLQKKIESKKKKLSAKKA